MRTTYRRPTAIVGIGNRQLIKQMAWGTGCTYPAEGGMHTVPFSRIDSHFVFAPVSGDSRIKFPNKSVKGEIKCMNTEIINTPAEVLGWTPEEETRIEEIIATFDAAEVNRILRYSTLRMEAIRRMRREQMKNAPLHVDKVKPNASVIPAAELERRRPFGRPRKYDSNAARQRAYRQRLSRTLQKPSVTGSFQGS